MPAPAPTARRAGFSVLVLFCLGFVALFLRAQDVDPWPRLRVIADFRSVGGLRVDSPVQLGGAHVGRVMRIDFVRTNYTCDPMHEDRGRVGQGRTDDCDSAAFCSPIGWCAELEPFGEAHTSCWTSLDCGPQEMCVTPAFRRRANRVEWTGPMRVCARYNTSLVRTRVEMRIAHEGDNFLRVDSVAMIANNSVLGDQLVRISMGRGERLSPPFRLRTHMSLAEDIDRFRRRIDRAIERADVSLQAMSDVINALAAPDFLDDIKSIMGHADTISGQVARHDGLVGALVGDPRYRRDIGETLGGLAGAASGLEKFVGVSNSVLTTVNRNAEPAVADFRSTLTAVNGVFESLERADNHALVARLLRDSSGRLEQPLVQSVHNLAVLSDDARALMTAVSDERGSLGKVLGDPVVAERFSAFLASVAHRPVLRDLLLWYLRDKKHLIDHIAARDPAAP